MASAGGRLGSDEVRELFESGIAHGLAEVMNFPAVIAGDEEVLAKIAAAKGRPIDGHAPGVSGKGLSAYAAAGIASDHECVTAEEAKEKLRRGLYLLIREATNARNLDALLPAITHANSRRICFCTDDRTPVHLLETGSVDEMVRRAIATGIDPIEAIRMVTLNTSEMYGLREIGAIAPGRIANLVVFDDLQAPNAKLVFTRGKRTAENGRALAAESLSLRDDFRPKLGSCAVNWDAIRWEIPAKGKLIRVIGSLPDQLLTEHRILPAMIADDRTVADVSHDILKMLVIERHRGTGNFGVGFIQGFGLKRGAIAGTVAHDHHNLVTIGADDVSMQTAARAAVATCGGLAVAVGEQVIAHLPLPVGGLMSDQPITEVAAGYAKLISAARGLGSPLADPFMAMSFMALEVIPSLKLTDQGLVDVEAFRMIDLFVS
jgi:adenine deaminase